MPTSGSNNTSSKWKREVLDHIALYGLTSHRALKRAVFAGDGAAANEVVRAMLGDGTLYRHDGLLTTSKFPPEQAELHRDRIILHHCCLGTRLRPLVRRGDLEQLLSPIAEECGLSVPKNARCVIDRERRLSLLRVQPLVSTDVPLDLGRELGKLQSMVEGESFRIWSALATQGGFSISYLLLGQTQSKELALWLDRRPLFATARSQTIHIPVQVHHVRMTSR